MLGRGIRTPSGTSTDVTRNGMITLTRICHRRGRKGLSVVGGQCIDWEKEVCVQCLLRPVAIKKLPSSSPQSNGLSKFSILWLKNNTNPVEVTPYFDFFLSTVFKCLHDDCITA